MAAYWHGLETEARTRFKKEREERKKERRRRRDEVCLNFWWIGSFDPTPPEIRGSVAYVRPREREKEILEQLGERCPTMI